MAGRHAFCSPAILFYGGYYALYLQQSFEIWAEAARLRSNPGYFVAFDSSVLERTVSRLPTSAFAQLPDADVAAIVGPP